MRSTDDADGAGMGMIRNWRATPVERRRYLLRGLPWLVVAMVAWLYWFLGSSQGSGTERWVMALLPIWLPIIVFVPVAVWRRRAYPPDSN